MKVHVFMLLLLIECLFQNRAGKARHAARLNIYGKYVCLLKKQIIIFFSQSMLDVMYDDMIKSRRKQIHSLLIAVYHDPKDIAA